MKKGFLTRLGKNKWNWKNWLRINKEPGMPKNWKKEWFLKLEGLGNWKEIPCWPS